MFDKKIIVSIIALLTIPLIYSNSSDKSAVNHQLPQIAFEMAGVNDQAIGSGATDNPVKYPHEYPEEYNSDGYGTPDGAYQPFIPFNSNNDPIYSKQSVPHYNQTQGYYSAPRYTNRNVYGNYNGNAEEQPSRSFNYHPNTTVQSNLQDQPAIIDQTTINHLNTRYDN